MHVPLSPETLERLRMEASRRGVDPEDFARQIIEEQLESPALTPDAQRMIELMDQWDREDQTNDPAELARRQSEFDEFKRAINESHSSSRKIYP